MVFVFVPGIVTSILGRVLIITKRNKPRTRDSEGNERNSSTGSSWQHQPTTNHFALIAPGSALGNSESVVWLTQSFCVQGE